MKTATPENMHIAKPHLATLLACWVIASAAGYGAFVVIYQIVALVVPTRTEWAIIASIGGLVGAAAITGVAEGLILKHYLAGFLWFNWAARTVLSYILVSGPAAFFLLLQVAYTRGYGFGDGSDAINSLIVTTACFSFALLTVQGAAVGILQGQAFRAFRENYASWVVTNLLVFPVTTISVVVATLAFGREGIQPDILIYFAILAGAVSGACTGTVLVHLLRQKVRY